MSRCHINEFTTAFSHDPVSCFFCVDRPLVCTCQWSPTVWHYHACIPAPVTGPSTVTVSRAKTVSATDRVKTKIPKFFPI